MSSFLAAAAFINLASSGRGSKASAATASNSGRVNQLLPPLKRSILSKMGLPKCESSTVGKKDLFLELYDQIKKAAPRALLSYGLRNQLERCDESERSEMASRVMDGCSPLFIACKKGNVEIVEYLVSVCKANVEVRGRYEVQDDRTVHTVTPLWCASVAGKLKVVEVLVKYGADVNSVSDTGSTPVRSACFMTHLDIVRLLVENGADIQRPNYNGGTCLINSVQSVELCEFLLKNGAYVNAQDLSLIHI